MALLHELIQSAESEAEVLSALDEIALQMDALSAVHERTILAPEAFDRMPEGSLQRNFSAPPVPENFVWRHRDADGLVIPPEVDLLTLCVLFGYAQAAGRILGLRLEPAEVTRRYFWARMLGDGGVDVDKEDAFTTVLCSLENWSLADASPLAGSGAFPSLKDCRQDLYCRCPEMKHRTAAERKLLWFPVLQAWVWEIARYRAWDLSRQRPEPGGGDPICGGNRSAPTPLEEDVRARFLADLEQNCKWYGPEFVACLREAHPYIEPEHLDLSDMEEAEQLFFLRCFGPPSAAPLH